MTTGFYNKYLLFIAGLGGLLYGIDVGVIAGALPYLQATTDYSAAQLSTVVAAVLGGSVLSSLFAGALADLFGRKWLMIVSGICFVLSVPVICIPSGFGWLVAGRILQGAAAGFIGVVVPLYLAESLTADKRGFGTGMFQFMLTVGLVFAALVGLYFAQHVETIAETGTAADILAAKNFAWRAIFWACAVPGVIFTLGAFAISDSPRWLYRKGKLQAALAALTRSHGADKAQTELDEMGKAEKAAQEEAAKTATVHKDSLLQKKYVVPFVLAVVILACNQATGINSVLAYIVDVLKQAGLEGAWANAGDLSVKILNMVMTLVAMFLVDRLGRKALLTIGTSSITPSIPPTTPSRVRRTSSMRKPALRSRMSPARSNSTTSPTATTRNSRRRPSKSLPVRRPSSRLRLKSSTKRTGRPPSSPLLFSPVLRVPPSNSSRTGRTR